MKNNIVSRKAYRTLCLLLTVLSFLFSLTGCYQKYTANYLKKFSKYLEYSMGDYSVKEKTKFYFRNEGMFNIDNGEGWSCTLEYTSDDQSRRSFSFKNSPVYSEDSDGENFGYIVREEAISLCGDYLEHNFINKNYNLTETNMNIHLWWTTFHDPSGEKEEYKKFIDEKTGLKLSSITLKELTENWGVKFEIHVSTTIVDEAGLEAVKGIYEKMMRDIFSYMNPEGIEMIADFGGEHGQQSIVYDQASDSFSWVEYLHRTN